MPYVRYPVRIVMHRTWDKKKIKNETKQTC